MMEQQENLIEKVCNECGGLQKYKIIQVGKKNIELISKMCKCLEDKERLLEDKRRIEEEKRIQRENEEYIQHLKRKCMMDIKFKNSTFSNWNKTNNSKKVINICKSYFINFDINYDENIGMFLTGGVGIGKTYAVSSLANELMNKGTGVICTSINKLLRGIKNNYSKGISEDIILNDISSVPLLILDDLGTEQNTEWFTTMFYEIIDTRYRTNKPLIITSNLTIEQIENRYHKRINSRIFEMCVPVECGHGDIREIQSEKKLKKLALELQEQI
ncbi:ATP-binding protein [Clostridium sp. ZBS4]|uniref:ATP-binding protein n=1 Tax=Clostridium sp. ZBS4 TaxID=2949974 RepID=UPI00207A81AC|nr:ATP-binding protein [Clostridium sp. ZBS4]